MDDITLVIPAKKEAESLPEVLNELLKYRIKKIIVINVIFILKKINFQLLLDKQQYFTRVIMY